MKFGVVYSFDVPWEVSVGMFMPPQKKLFQQTEGDEQYEFGHLEGRWDKGKHRKFVGVLDKKQFELFLDRTGMYAEETETMGILGAPWAIPPWMGTAPAISFTSDDPDGYQNAYVTPLPDVEGPEEYSYGLADRVDRYWKLIKLAVLSKYGCGSGRCPIASALDETAPCRP